MLRNLFLMETETICLLKRDLNSWSRSTMWNLSTLALVSISNKLMLSELELEDAHHGCVESRREQVRLQEELVMKEKALRDTQIRSIHEMGEMKRAEELRVDKFSVQKIERKSWHDTETHFTNTRFAREGELHELFWRISRCRIELWWKTFLTFPVNQQSFQVHVLCQAATKRLPLDRWNTSGTLGNVFGNPRSYVRFITDHLIKEFFTLRLHVPQVRLQCKEVQGHLSQEVKNELGARPQCRCLKEGRQPWIFFCQWKYHRLQGLDSKDNRYRSFSSTNSLHPQRFFMWFKTQVATCSDFPSDAMLWTKEVEMVDSVGWSFKSSRSIDGTHFPNFEMLDARIASSLNKIIQNSNFKKKGQSRGTEKLRKRIGFFEEDRSLTWFTTTSESLALMIPFLATPIYSLSLFATTMFRTSIRDWMKFYYQRPRSHLMMSLKVCTNWRIRESDQLKTVLELYDIKIHQKISVPNYQKLKNDGEEKHRSETSITKLWR